MKFNLIKLGKQLQQFYTGQFQVPPESSPMHNKIMISLSDGTKGEPGPRAAWLVRDTEGKVLEAVQDGDLSELRPAQGDELQVVVHSQAILLAEAVLPSLSAYRLQQALPYALEEQVLDELDLLHFAPGPRDKSQGKTPVAIVKKTLVNDWLQFFQDKGLRPDQLVPAVFTLPYQENLWQVLIEGNTATVRMGLYAGFSSELENLETLLSLKLQEVVNKPEKLLVYCDKKSSFTFSTLKLPVETLTLTPEQKLMLAAETLNQFPPLNLLQGAFASKRKLWIAEKNKRAFRLGAYALSIWLGLILLSHLGSLLILSFERHHLRSQIAEIYQRHFPNTETPLDPRGRLEVKLKKALAQSEKNRLFQWLGYLAKSTASVRIQSFSFQNQQLSLELLAASFASLDEFILSLKAQGVEVKQQNAALAGGNQVKAVLLIEGRAA